MCDNAFPTEMKEKKVYQTCTDVYMKFVRNFFMTFDIRDLEMIGQYWLKIVTL